MEEKAKSRLSPGTKSLLKRFGFVLLAVLILAVIVSINSNSGEAVGQSNFIEPESIAYISIDVDGDGVGDYEVAGVEVVDIYRNQDLKTGLWISGDLREVSPLP